MNCRIPYIINTVKDSGLDEDKYIPLATNAHKDVVKSLLNQSIAIPLTIEGTKRLYLKHEYINSLPIKEGLKAKGLYDDDESKSVIKFFDTEVNGKPYVYIGINVFNSPDLVEDGLPVVENRDKTFNEIFYDELFVLPSIAKLQTHLEQVVEKDSEGMIEKFAEDIVIKLKSYENSLETTTDNYQVAVSKKEIDKLIRSLENQDNLALAKGVNNYVVQSVNKLNYLSQLFFGATNEYITRQKRRLSYLEKQLKENPNDENILLEIRQTQNKIDNPPKSIKQRLKDIEEKRKSNSKQDKIDVELELKDINDLLQQGRYFYHLFDNLSLLYKEVSLLEGGKKDVDKFNKTTLSNNLINFVNQFNKDNNKDLDPDEIGKRLFDENGLLTLTDLSGYLTLKDVTNVPDFIYNLNSMLADISANKKTFIETLEQSMKHADILKESMNDLYVDVFTTTFYPEYLNRMEEFKKKAKQDKEEDYLNDKYFLEVDAFKQLVKVALKDVSIMSHYIRETIGLNDQVTQLVASFIKDALNDVRRKNIKENNEFEKVRKAAKLDDMSREDREMLFDKFIYKTKKISLNSFGKIKHILTLSEDEKLLPSNQQEAILIAKMQQENASKKNRQNGISYEPIRIFNETYYVQMLDEEDVLKEYDDFTYRNEKTLFNQFLPRKVKEVFDKFPVKAFINKDRFLLKQSLQELDNEYGTNLLDSFMYYGIDNSTQLPFAELKSIYNSMFSEEGDLDYDSLKNTIKLSLTNGFFKERIKNKGRVEVKNMLLENKLMTITDEGVNEFNIIGIENSIEIKRNLEKFTNKKTNTKSTTSKNNRLLNDIAFNMNTIFGIEIKVKEDFFKKILVEKYDEDTGMFYFDSIVYKKVGEKWQIEKGNEENVTSYYTNKGELLDFTDEYKKGGSKAFPYDKTANQKLANISSLPIEHQNIYKLLKDFKDAINDKLGRKRFYGLFNIPKIVEQTLMEKSKNVLKGIGEKIDVTYKDETVPKSRFNFDTKKTEFLDENDNVVEEKDAARISKKRYGIDGNVINSVDIDFSEYIPPHEREKDLLYTFAEMNMRANNYALRTTIVPKVNTIQTIYSGDEKAGVGKRQAYKLGPDGQKIIDRSGKPITEDADKLSENLKIFLDDMLYGMSKKEYALALGNVKIDLHKVVTNITGLSAYQALALNFASMPANHFISTIANYSEAAMGRNFDKKIFRETYRELFVSPTQWKTYVADWSKPTFSDKSKLAQLAVMFNAIQGEFLDNSGIVHKDNLAEKFLTDVWMSTSSATEYTNQLLTMVSLMKGWKQKDDKGNVVMKKDSKGQMIESTLYNSVIHKEGELVEFEDWVTEDVQRKFTSLVQTINRQLHGNYKDEDKNLLNRTWFGRLALLFKRWIYNTWMSRLQGEQLDWESYTIEEGYYMTYLSKLTKQYKEDFAKYGMKGFVNKEVAPKYLKAIGTTVLKSGVESLRSGLRNIPLLSAIPNYKELFDNEKYDEWMYGKDINERQKRALIRTSADMGLILQMMFIGFLMHLAAEGEDDEEAKIVLKWIEFYAFKMQAEMRFYTPFLYYPSQGLPGSYTIDTIQRFAKDPFTMTRMIDVNLGLIRDLIDVSMFNEEGEIEFDWAANDIYERSGKGYEKGDYKIVSKLEKSVIAPYYQVLRLKNPEQLLEYMDLIFKNN